MFLDILRPLNIENAETLAILPDYPLDMVMNYAVIPAPAPKEDGTTEGDSTTEEDTTTEEVNAL